MNIKILQIDDPQWLAILEKTRHDLYHLPKYIALEAERNKSIPEAILILDGENFLFLPYLIRSCQSLFEFTNVRENFDDIISPYGYPGLIISNSAMHDSDFLKSSMRQLKQTLQERKFCSAFIRLHPIVNENLTAIFPEENFTDNGETISIDLTLSEEQIWLDTRSSHRNKINKCKRMGMTARMVPLGEYLDSFMAIYQETMDRQLAHESYYFNRDYYSNIYQLGEKVHLCIVELETNIICAGIFFECSGILQYHLGGTKNEYLKFAPSKLMFDWVRFWGKARGNKYLHLGGGLGGSQDSLHYFKSGFSKQRHKFLTWRLIIDRQKYFDLVELRARFLQKQTQELLDSGFFPAYRQLV
jgi:hypothetical protein